jgi:AraC-like DNA-binding protein
LRRWTAAFLGAVTLSHLWYTPLLYLTSAEDIKMVYFVGTLLDLLTVFPLAIAVLFIMLQDRRRPLWPIGVIVAPLAAGIAVCIATRSDDILQVLYVYYLLLIIGLIIYMVRETRQYGRWLHDNFADLEHKEVWHSFMVLAGILMGFSLYAFELQGLFFKCAAQMNVIILTLFLLWRVETLSDLTIQKDSGDEIAPLSGDEVTSPDNLKTSQPHNLTSLLQQHCIDTQLYLQHDLTLMQLARAVGTNRYYLSRYFSQQGTTYNAYINGLRIDYFINLYRMAAADEQSFTVKQMAEDSGYRNYATFSSAFKQRMGKNVTAWMQDNDN